MAQIILHQTVSSLDLEKSEVPQKVRQLYSMVAQMGQRRGMPSGMAEDEEELVGANDKMMLTKKRISVTAAKARPGTEEADCPEGPGKCGQITPAKNEPIVSLPKKSRILTRAPPAAKKIRPSVLPTLPKQILPPSVTPPTLPAPAISPFNIIPPISAVRSSQRDHRFDQARSPRSAPAVEAS